MPVLANAKHERFAQSLAKGKGQAEAYADAGYAPSEPNASRLTSNEKVRTRVSELQERTALRTEITAAAITDRLLALADLMEKTGIGRDPETGEITASSSKHMGVLRNTLMDVAKLNGLVTDKIDMSTKHGLSEDLAEWLNQRG